MSKMKLALAVVSDLKALAESIETLVQTMEGQVEQPASQEKSKDKNTEPQTDAPANETQPTLEEVRAAMANKNREGKREAVKGILNKYGADKLTALDPTHFAQALKDVGEIR